jgi:signal transduction histidine kinase
MAAHALAAPAGGREVALPARLAHELRTPISAVIAYAEVLKDEHFGPHANARYRDYARDIYATARHALDVVDGMLQGDLDRSGVPPLVFADVDVAGVVESCLSVVQPLAERAGLELGMELAPRLPRVVADEVSLRQMLLNLLANAVKFARRGDRVAVTAAYDGDGPLSICVADTGPGMGQTGAQAPADGPLAAMPAAANAGLGLGLPLTRALAEANGATLAIDSAPGCGTRVTLSFGKDRIVPV